MSDEDRLVEFDMLLRGMEKVFADHFDAKGLTMIPRQPPHELIMNMSEVQRGKRSKAEYMTILYHTMLNHFRNR